MTLTTETGGAVPPPAPRREPVPDSSLNIADPIGAVLGIGRMDPHSESRAIFLPTVHGATGRNTQSVLPILADTGDPRGTDNRPGLHETENRGPYRLSRIRAPGTHRAEAECTRYSDAEDPRHRTDEVREQRRWRYRDNREERHRRYRGAGERGYPSDDDPFGSEDSRRRSHRARRDRNRGRRRHDPSDSESYHMELDEERRRPSRHLWTAAKGDERRPTVIRPLNDLFTTAVNYKTYRLKGVVRATTPQ